jgi:hypothetical protein
MRDYKYTPRDPDCPPEHPFGPLRCPGCRSIIRTLARGSRYEQDLQIGGVSDPYEGGYPKNRGEYRDWEPLDRHLEALEHAELIVYREIRPEPDHEAYGQADHDGIARIIDLDERGMMRLDADVAALYEAWDDRPAGARLTVKPRNRRKAPAGESLEERLERRRALPVERAHGWSPVGFDSVDLDPVWDS